MAASRGYLWWKRIVVGPAFLRLTLPEQNAVLSHEVCHCKRFHLERRLFSLPLLFLNPCLSQRIAVSHEFEADAFAAHRGLGPELLSVLRKLPHGGNFYPSRKEREEALKRIIGEQA
jgi:Zn-dependent protease with chaperone function